MVIFKTKTSNQMLLANRDIINLYYKCAETWRDNGRTMVERGTVEANNYTLARLIITAK